ncbi:hypothetical protein [Bacteroides sp. 51]|uniref:hypothetical protein n=1 Tax=Bacteroides sp. 51 TaxID=2302938 RepID=UPI001940267D|nr:hypothetical protein [Bacteroides sp. 51]
MNDFFYLFIAIRKILKQGAAFPGLRDIKNLGVAPGYCLGGVFPEILYVSFVYLI